MIAGVKFDRSTTIATLEQLGKTYMAHQLLEDAENIFLIILRTGRDKFNQTQIFHETMCRASRALENLRLTLGDTNAAMKYAVSVKYHENAAKDSVQVEKMCKTMLIEEAEYSESDHDFYPSSSSASRSLLSSDSSPTITDSDDEIFDFSMPLSFE